MNVKKWLNDKINKKAARREKLTEEIAQRHKNVEEFVLKLLEELDNNIHSSANASLFDSKTFRNLYVHSMQERIKTLDRNARVEISWATEGGNGVLPRINGVLIKWSSDYQVQHGCEPELFVDIAALLLK